MGWVGFFSPFPALFCGGTVISFHFLSMFYIVTEIRVCVWFQTKRTSAMTTFIRRSVARVVLLPPVARPSRAHGGCYKVAHFFLFIQYFVPQSDYLTDRLLLSLPFFFFFPNAIYLTAVPQAGV